MAGDFKYFVVFAEMRTGSNFLEQNINQFPDLCSHGELFNPHFIGGANKDALFGVSLKAREKDPFQLLGAIAEDGKIPGFRFFNGHDPRILAHCLNDPACGKVILTRNVLDAY
ncbi:MAG: nodulation protein NodH, partial [Alphaproteobacteria bacterium]|nr:nodulation protein NodH [Alphaproteobacteria bacterium]